MQYSIKTCYTLSKYCNDPNVVNCPLHFITTFGSFTTVGQFRTFAHLYGQLTTVGLFTTIWSCTTFELFRLTIVCSFTTFGQFTTPLYSNN
jgi:hypothetical protein